MSTPFTYRQLDAWKLGMDLVTEIYRVTNGFPKSEQYAVTAQIRRAAVSIPSNIAEGHCRRSTKAYANHISIALGSHAELETCLDLSSRVGFLNESEQRKLIAMADSVGRLLNGLYKALERRLWNH